MTAHQSEIFIKYDDSVHRLMVIAPVWANDALVGVPSKRWSKPKRAWMLPLTRENVKFVREQLIKPGYARTDDSALIAMAAHDHDAAALPKRGDSKFPSWYKFKREPLPHERKALDKWWGNKVFALHMDRGTRKTACAINMAAALRMNGDIDCVLVVVKLGVRRTWEDELAVGCPIPYTVHLPYTTQIPKYNAWLAKPHDFQILVVGTESLSAGGMHTLAKDFLAHHQRPLMIIDESHRIANHKAAVTQRVMEMVPATARRATLSGSPSKGKPLNLYSQFEWLDTNIIGLGDFYAFRNRYAIMGGYTPREGPFRGKPMEVVGYQNVEELSKLIAPYVFEVQKKDVLDLPPKVYKKIYVELSKEQRKLYDEIRKTGMYTRDGREHTIKNVLETALRLQQVAGGWATTYTEEQQLNGKIKRIPHVEAVVPVSRNPKVAEVIELVGDGKPIVIWCAYRPEIDACVAAIRKAFPKEKVYEIHGGISEGERDIAKSAFQSGRARIIVGNTQTGGEGITLTACEVMVYFNNTEKLVDRDQSEDRAHRSGLKHSVLYVDICAENTVDETILASLADKMDLSEYLRLRIREASDLLAGTIAGQRG